MNVFPVCFEIQLAPLHQAAKAGAAAEAEAAEEVRLYTMQHDNVVATIHSACHVIHQNW
jgi:hypothetical protein